MQDDRDSPKRRAPQPDKAEQASRRQLGNAEHGNEESRSQKPAGGVLRELAETKRTLD